MTFVQATDLGVRLPTVRRHFLAQLGTFLCELCRDAERYASAAHQVYVSPFEPDRLLQDPGRLSDVQREHREASWEGHF
jgi:hypothetical protein